MNIPDQTTQMGNHEELAVRLPSGRYVHVWFCDHDDHESIDVWMTDGKPSHATSERTGAPERAPMGVFGMVNGTRVMLKETGHTEHNWPAVSTIVLMFDKATTEGGES